MTDDQPQWMHSRTYHMEDLQDLNGNTLHLPSILRHSFCYLCRVMVVRAGLSTWQKAAIANYMRYGWIRFRSHAHQGRPVCKQCARDQGVCDAINA